MKKNYICRLQQYDAKTTLKDKQHLYMKKFVKTCYSPTNKENEDPNISSKKHGSHNKEQNKSIKTNQLPKTRASDRMEEADQPTQLRPVSQFRQIQINPYECELNSKHNSNMLYLVEDNQRKIICCEHCSVKFLNKTVFFDKDSNQNSFFSQENWESLVNIKLECVKVERFLSKQQAQQIQKCDIYYELLQTALEDQHENANRHIKATYQKAREALSRKIDQLQCFIKASDRQKDQLPIQQRFCSYLSPQESQLQIDIAIVRMNELILEKAIEEISKFDIKHLAFIYSQPEGTLKTASHSAQHEQLKCLSQKVNEDSLTCSEEMVEARMTQTISNQLDISFEQNEDFIYSGDYPLVADTHHQPGISPSFKYF